MARTIEFTKLHGAGNDFVVIDGMQSEIDLDQDQVVALCDRHFGIGADGVIIVKPPEDGANAGFMDYRNADGTLAQMCGNGVRCTAKFLVDSGYVDKNTPLVSIETRAGVKAISYTTDDNGELGTATVDMGAPQLNAQQVPTTLSFNAMSAEGEAYVGDAEIESPFGTYRFTCVSMGNPHAVTFVDDCDAVDIDAVGAYFESCDAFPEKANIEFATVTSKGIKMRVFERGCGETLACGTGACATGVAAYLTGRAGAENDVILRGGVLHIAYLPGKTVLMTGPAAKSYCGTVLV